MPLTDFIDRFFNKPSVRNFISEKSALSLFIWLLGGVVAAVGLIGKILDLDKSIASWISQAYTINQATKAPELKWWFVCVVFLVLVVATSFMLLLLYTVTRRYARTKDQAALDDVMGAVRRIRDQTKNTKKIKAWKSISFTYLIHKDLSGTVRQTAVMKAVNFPVHFWEHQIGAEDEVDDAESLAAINYTVEDSASPAADIVYLPAENGKKAKRACLFFLPQMEAGDARQFQVSYEWPRLFKRLKTSEEDFDYETYSLEKVESYRLEVYLQKGAVGALECEITGDQHCGQTLTPASHSEDGWKGLGYIYEVKNIPAGDIHLVLRTKLNA
jgi:hypothetical protein